MVVYIETTLDNFKGATLVLGALPKSQKNFFSDILSPHDIINYLQDDSFQEGVILSCLSITFDMPTAKPTGKICKFPLDIKALNSSQSH